MDNSEGLLEKEIRDCEQTVKDYQLQKNSEYYRGLHDAYIHLIRFIKQQRGEQDG